MLSVRTMLVVAAVAVLGAGAIAVTLAARSDGQDATDNGGRPVQPVVTTDADWAPVANAIGRPG